MAGQRGAVYHWISDIPALHHLVRRRSSWRKGNIDPLHWFWQPSQLAGSTAITVTGGVALSYTGELQAAFCHSNSAARQRM